MLCVLVETTVIFEGLQGICSVDYACRRLCDDDGEESRKKNGQIAAALSFAMREFWSIFLDFYCQFCTRQIVDRVTAGHA